MSRYYREACKPLSLGKQKTDGPYTLMVDSSVLHEVSVYTTCRGHCRGQLTAESSMLVITLQKLPDQKGAHL